MSAPPPAAADAHVDVNEFMKDEWGEVALRYTLAFLGWVMRNPKTVSNVIVTLMLVLFTNYAQQIVVEVVDYSVRAHPNLQPSDELRSRAAVLGNDLKSLINVAKITGAAYVQRNVSCWDVNSIASTEFLNVPYSLQSSFGVSLYFVYVSYKIGNTSRWGDCGCQSVSEVSKDFGICSYVDSNGLQSAFLGINRTAQVGAVGAAFSETSDYVRVISGLTRSDESSGGVWHAPTVYQDPFVNRSFPVITYSFPILFDASGHCVAAVSIDVFMSNIAQHLQIYRTPSEVVMVGYGRGSNGDLKFITDSIEGTLSNTQVFRATATPRARINSLVALMSNVQNADQSYTGVMQNISFVQNGIVYEMLTILDTWAILSKAPTAQSAGEVGDALNSLTSEFVASAGALRSSYSISSESCVVSADANRSSLFIREMSNFLRAFGGQIYGAYLAYSSSSSSHGACGCEQLNVTAQSCYYVDSNSNLLRYSNARSPTSDMTSNSFSQTKRSAIISTYLPTLTKNKLNGSWTPPYLYIDPDFNISTPLLTFMLPNTFDKDGNCDSAVFVDVSLTAFPKLLRKFTHNGTSDLLLTDTSTSTFISSTTMFFTDDVYPMMQTPNATVNNIISQVAAAIGTGQLSFPLSLNDATGASVINFGIADGRWGIIEIMSVNEALNRFYPIPSITSSSQALALLPPDINIGLFFIVLGIIFLYTLNIFLLGCSYVGNPLSQISAPPAAAVPPPPPVPVPAPEPVATADVVSKSTDAITVVVDGNATLTTDVSQPQKAL